MEETVQSFQTMAVEELGYTNLRVKQKEAILHVHYLQGKDVFVSLPTGSGKAFATTYFQ